MGASREAARMRRSMERQVDMERQMNVDGARQERKNAEREAHQETEEIEVIPGHKTPRDAAPRCVDWNSGREPDGSVIQGTCRRWMTTAVMLGRMENFAETFREAGRAENFRKE